MKISDTDSFPLQAAAASRNRTTSERRPFPQSTGREHRLYAVDESGCRISNYVSAVSCSTPEPRIELGEWGTGRLAT